METGVDPVRADLKSSVALWTRSLQGKIIVPVILSGIATIGLCVGYMIHLKEENTRLVGLTTTTALSNQVATLRTIYTEHVVAPAREAGMRIDHDFEGAPDTLPLPASMVKLLGLQLAKDHPGTSVRLYSRHPFPHRAATERYDAFEKEAMDAVERSPEAPFYRFEELNGRLSIRYAIADVMRENCVNCHNSHPDTPKKGWRVGDVRGVLEVIVPVDAAESSLLRGTRSVGALIATALLLSTVLTVLATRRAVRPAAGLRRVLSDVGSGNLNVAVKHRSADELGAIAESTDMMVSRLREMVTSLRTASVEVGEAVEEILASSQEHEQGSVEQSAGFEEISRTATGNAEAARAIAASAKSMGQTADGMLKAAQSGRDALETTRGSMRDIVAQNDIVSSRIKTLYERSQDIIQVVDVINDISDRLDILALNAALEGSRAGEVGKGFSLVAQEMRRLAESVSASTNEIKRTVRDIHVSVQAALDASTQSSSTVGAGVRESERMSTSFSEIVGFIENGASAARQITGATQQQLSSTEQMVRSLSEMSAVSRQSLDSSRNVTQAATELRALASRLREKVTAFQVGDSSGQSS